MSFLTTEAAQHRLGIAGVPPFPTSDRGAEAGGLTKQPGRLAGGLMSAREPGRGDPAVAGAQQQPPAGPSVSCPIFSRYYRSWKR